METSEAIQLFIRHLITAVSSAALYTSDHDQVQRMLSAAREHINLLPGEITLTLLEDTLIADGVPLEANLSVARCARLMESAGIGFLQVQPGVSGEELQTLVGALIPPAGGERQPVSSSAHIRVGQVELRYASSAATAQAERTPADLAQQEPRLFLDLCEAVRAGGQPKVSAFADFVRGIIAASNGDAVALLSLARDHAFTHFTTVCLLTLAQAASLGIKGQDLHDIGLASIFHDVGKLFVPEEILAKQGELSATEWEIVRQHPVRGARFLLDTPGVPRLAVIVAYEHHLNYDLSGYPQVPPGWKVNLCSHLTMISDCFDALRSRPEPPAMAAIAALMLERAGKELHPELTRNFLGLLKRLPV